MTLPTHPPAMIKTGDIDSPLAMYLLWFLSLGKGIDFDPIQHRF